MRDTVKSRAAFQEAKKVITGGVNSPVRAFKGVGGSPLFFAYGNGSSIHDIDGNGYLDYVGSWGPLILGHAHPGVVKAIHDAAEKGTSFGAPTLIETALARTIIQQVPSIELVRFVNSGTEATMSAARLARGYTKRDCIVKFEGCYHGHGDSFLIAAGSGAATLGIPDSSGVTIGTARDTLIAHYNDLDSVKMLFEKHGERIAAIIVEPVAGNMGVVAPREGFLKGLRDITTRFGSLLIFDEVMTGFRVSAGGAQELYGIRPDLSTFGKVIGGGLPVGAYGGNRRIMEQMAPLGSIYQAGTLSGNPLAMAAGLATLTCIRQDPDFYQNLERRSARLADGLMQNCLHAGVQAVLNRVGSMMTLFFTDRESITDWNAAKTSDTAVYARYFRESLQNGVYFAPSQFEAAFVSAAHSDDDIEKTIIASSAALRKCY
ncbi:MAG: glutamate-1-semialdehyde 2,1-aminomutase [Chitinispirillaceae bacterium]|jgi:glutamate-1-semialdehyde 2,1-aminomutase